MDKIDESALKNIVGENNIFRKTVLNRQQRTGD